MSLGTRRSQRAAQSRAGFCVRACTESRQRKLVAAVTVLRRVHTPLRGDLLGCWVNGVTSNCHKNNPRTAGGSSQIGLLGSCLLLGFVGGLVCFLLSLNPSKNQTGAEGDAQQHTPPHSQKKRAGGQKPRVTDGLCGIAAWGCGACSL